MGISPPAAGLSGSKLRAEYTPNSGRPCGPCYRNWPPETENRPTPDKFSNRGKSRKNTSPAAGVFLASQPRERARVLTSRTRSRCQASYSIWVRYHLMACRTKPIGSETRKAERWSGANHSSIGDSWPMAFSGYPRGHKVSSRDLVLQAPQPNGILDTRPRTRASGEPTGHRRDESRDDSRQTLKLLAVLDIQRRNGLLSSKRSK